MGLRQEWENNARREGKTSGRAAIVLKQLRLKFGELSAGTVDRVHRATPDELECWAERVSPPRALDRIFE